MPRRISAVTAVLTVLAFATASAASAIPPADNPYAPVMVVLDSSGSMKARDAGGTGTRLDAAKQAVGTMVEQLPEIARVGLAIYGAGTGSAGSDKAAGCRDVRVVQKLGIVDKAAFKTAVNGAQARGYTPIGQALRTAAAQLPPEGQRSIVLVSDGEDTCAPPQPCDVAKELRRQGVDLHIHTIGFKIGPAARAQLTCIAQATGGGYYDADNADALTGVLGRVTERALRDFQPVGKAVNGTADPATAPLLSPGQYVDSLNAEEERFYAVDLKEGDTLHLAATMVIPRGGNRTVDTLDLGLTGPGGARCGPGKRELGVLSSGGVTAALAWRDLADGSGTTVCDKPGRYAFRISRDAKGKDRVPVELMVRVEPPVTSGADGPAENSAVGFTAPPAGTGSPVRGGGSFSNAGTLSGSGRYTDTIDYGEELFYRVKLDWGQGLAYKVTASSADRNGPPANLSTTLLNPVRRQLHSTDLVYIDGTEVLPMNGSAIATTRTMYQNRKPATPHVISTSIDGWYYLTVRLAGPGTSSTSSGGGVQLALDLTVAGDKVDGPRYGRFSGTPTSTPSTTPTTEPSGSATPVVDESDDAGQPEDTGSALPWVIAGVAVLVAIGGVAAALLSRRRR